MTLQVIIVLREKQNKGGCKMIAIADGFGIDSRFIEVIRYAEQAMEDLRIELQKEIARQNAIDKLMQRRFIPIKIPINRIYNQKPRNLVIRNNLPQRIRINEQSEP